MACNTFYKLIYLSTPRLPDKRCTVIKLVRSCGGSSITSPTQREGEEEKRIPAVPSETKHDVVLRPKTENRGKFKSYYTHTEDDLVREKHVEQKEAWRKKGLQSPPTYYRHIYPEFLPHRDMRYRHFLMDKLERRDMLIRRRHIDLPEFYVGSILAVTSADIGAPGKMSRFVGICIMRLHHGLRHIFVVRNMIDGEGVEVYYDLYNPTIHKIEVLRLEKRVDPHLLYLRDALPEYSTVDVNMQPVAHKPNTPVPVNTTKVAMKLKRWTQQWIWQELRGIRDADLVDIPVKKRIKFWKRHREHHYQVYDLMKNYRSTLPKEEQDVIYREILEENMERRSVDEVERKDKGERRGRRHWERQKLA